MRTFGVGRRGAVLCSGALILTLLAPATSEASDGVVVLTFGGPSGPAGRQVIARIVAKRYRVIPGEQLLAACDELGVPFGKGPNLARAAKHVGAGAVIGGKADRRRLTIAVFSGRSGSALVTRSVRWGTRPPKASVRQLAALLGKLLAREVRAEQPAGKQKDLSFAPEPVSQSGGSTETQAGGDTGSKPPKGGTEPQLDSDSKLAFDPSGVGAGGAKASAGGGAATSAGGDSPTDLRFSLNENPDAARPKPEAGVKAGPTSADDAPPRVSGSIGFGMWARSFTFNQPAESQTHSEYSSGAAIALGIALRAEPFAFFTKGFLEDVFLRLRFQTSLGLSSRTDPTSTDGFSTSMWELIVDGGYGWKVMDSASSPVVDIGLGGGSYSFSVDWQGKPEQLAAASYGFLLFGVGARYPFMRALDTPPGALLRDLGVELRFDYRIVFGAGQIAEDNWYGASSQGGLCLALGLNWRYKKFVAGLHYTYTRYFLDFDDATYAQRLADNKLAAGGALDQLHGVMVSGGYSY